MSENAVKSLERSFFENHMKLLIPSAWLHVRRPIQNSSGTGAILSISMDGLRKRRTGYLSASELPAQLNRKQFLSIFEN